MPPCTIPLCGKSSKTSNYKKDEITFHRYPNNPDMKQKWIIATKRENWCPSIHSVICSRHFEEDCFISMKNRRRLLRSAVPTRFLPILINTVESNAVTPSTSKESIPYSLDISVLNADIPATRNRKLFPTESPSNYNSPEKRRLCRRVIELSDKVVQKNRQIKNLRQKTIYLREKIATLKTIFRNLGKKLFIDPENADLLRKTFSSIPKVPIK